MTTPAPGGDRTGQPIRVSAVVLYRPDGHVLTVRKAGTSMFMFPGGKHHDGEHPRDTAVRELAEETGLVVPPGDLEYLGAFRTAAANEDGHELHSEVFALMRPLARNEVPEPTTEIEQLAWMDPRAARAPGGHGIAPLLTAVFPEILRRRPF
ncbi:NUDIX domain-containing protein [Citricoccus sp. SGAir0253]|uniref:NUDIX hydrolase n=1 Tax=Citricoccus sp. SGAir0253 TaxID=2567881 RepID=UPI0010CD5248|nr:NUDIX domain-containing protein [Citricoccus sp. SGAir0253]QCU79118.1 NUDIX domain-containing protein [Citricoccus sp. SGAir0253]